jgi:YVTN family beta-propeller protein
MKQKNTFLIAFVLILTLVTTLSCGAIPILTGNQGETPTEKPAEPEEPAATEEPAERVQLDPCSLLTDEEVGAALGGPVQMQPPQGMGGCVYVLQSDDPTVSTQLVISAAQGNEAKAFTMLSLGMLAGFSGDPDMAAEFEELNNQIADLTLVEVINRMAEMFAGTGVNVTQADGPGESALWLLYEDEFYSQGTLLVVSGEEYTSLTQIGGEMAAAPDQLASLAGMVFDRLPQDFYVFDEDGDGSFSFEYSSEEEPDEAAEPTPTIEALEVVTGLVWAAAPNAGQVHVIDPMTNQVIATIDIGRFPSDIAVAEGNVWVISETEGTLWRIDPITFEVVDTIALGGNTLHVAAGQGAVWVTGGLGVRKIDLATGTRYGVVYYRCYDVAIGENAIWVSESQGQQLLKIDPETRRVVATVKLEGKPSQVAYGHGTVWVILHDKNEVVGIDPNTHQVVTTLSSNSFIHGLAVDPDRVWYTHPYALNYYEPASIGSGGFNIANPPAQIEFYAGSLWVSSPNEGLITRINPEDQSVISVTRINPEDQSVISVIDLGTDPVAIAAGE